MRAVLAVATMLLTLGPPPEVHSPASGGPDFESASFEVSTDPTDLVLFLTERGGLGNATAFQFLLYGDGRLVRERVDNSNLKVLQSEEVALTFDETSEILDHAVRSGLAEFTSERVREVVGHDQAISVDSSTVVLEMNFIRYERPGLSERAPYTATARLTNPRIYARAYPELTEASALRRLQELVANHFIASSRSESERGNR